MNIIDMEKFSHNLSSQRGNTQRFYKGKIFTICHFTKYQTVYMAETLQMIKYEENFPKSYFIVQYGNHTGEKSYM